MSLIERITRRMNVLETAGLDSEVCVTIAGNRSTPYERDRDNGYQDKLSRDFNMTILNSYIRTGLCIDNPLPPPALPPSPPNAGVLGEGQVAKCPDGEYALASNPSLCMPCRVGGYCSGSQFHPCDRGTWNPSGNGKNASACMICPVDYTLHTAVFHSNLSRAEWPESASVDCTSGNKVRVRLGFFAHSPYSQKAFACANKDSCCGSDEAYRARAGCNVRSNSSGGDLFGQDACKQGHKGVLCGECEDDFYRSRRSCKACSDLERNDDAWFKDTRAAMIILIPLVTILFVMTILMYLQLWKPSVPCGVVDGRLHTRVLRPLASWYSRTVSQHLSVSSGIFKIMLSYCQCIGAVTHFDRIQWPGNFDAFIDFINQWLNIEIFTVLPAECLYGKRLGFMYEIVVAFLLPILFLVSVYLIILFSHLRLLKFQRTGALRGHLVGCYGLNDIRQQFRLTWRVFNSSRSYKLITFALLVSYPAITRKFLAIFNCISGEELQTKDDPASARDILLMREDPVFKCYEEEWWPLFLFGVLGLVLYVVCVPMIIYVFIRRYHASKKNRDMPLLEKREHYERVAFIVSSYKEKFWFFEGCWLLHKLLFTGVIHLIMPDTSVQIWAGSLMCVFFFFICMHYHPYNSYICNSVQLAALIQLLLTYLAMFLFQMDGGERSPVTRDPHAEDSYAWGAALIAINCSVFLLLIVLIWRGFVNEQVEQRLANMRKLLYHPQNIRVVMPELRPGCDYHVFLSHVWKSGQDQARTLKDRLIECLPDVKVFLDIDDMVEGVGKEYLDKSHHCLVFCTEGYFESKNCMRELLRAVVTHKQIITVIEPDPVHGAITKEEIRLALRKADGGKWQLWGLDEELMQWAADDNTRSDLPDADEVFQCLFMQEPIEWARVQQFQDVTMRLIADRVAETDGRQTYVPAELTHQEVAGGIPKLTGTKRFHIYTSVHNPGAADLMAEVCDAHGIRIVGIQARSRGRNGEMLNPRMLTRMGSRITFHGKMRRRSTSGRNLAELSASEHGLEAETSTEAAQRSDTTGRRQFSFSSWRDYIRNERDAEDEPLILTERPEHIIDSRAMVLYLNAKTWRDDGDGRAEQLAKDVEDAMRFGIQLILAHELPSDFDTDKTVRNACKFDDFFSHVDGSTPRDLIKNGIYSSIATPLMVGAWRDVSLKMLLLRLVDVHQKKRDTRRWHVAQSAFHRMTLTMSSRSSGSSLATKLRSVATLVRLRSMASRSQSSTSISELPHDATPGDMQADMERAAEVTTETTIVAKARRQLLDKLTDEERARVQQRLANARATYYARSKNFIHGHGYGHRVRTSPSAGQCAAGPSAELDDNVSEAGRSEVSDACTFVTASERSATNDPAVRSHFSDPGLLWAPSAQHDLLDSLDREILTPADARRRQLLERRVPVLKDSRDGSDTSEGGADVDDGQYSLSSWAPPVRARAFQRALVESRKQGDGKGSRQTIDRYCSAAGIVYTGITPNLDHSRGVQSVRADMKHVRAVDAKTTLPLLMPPGSHIDDLGFGSPRVQKSLTEVLRFARNIGLDEEMLLGALQHRKLHPQIKGPRAAAIVETSASLRVSSLEKLEEETDDVGVRSFGRVRGVLRKAGVVGKALMRLADAGVTTPQAGRGSCVTTTPTNPSAGSPRTPPSARVRLSATPPRSPAASAALAAALQGVSPKAGESRRHPGSLCVTDRRSLQLPPALPPSTPRSPSAVPQTRRLDEPSASAASSSDAERSQEDSTPPRSTRLSRGRIASKESTGSSDTNMWI